MFKTKYVHELLSGDLILSSNYKQSGYIIMILSTTKTNIAPEHTQFTYLLYSKQMIKNDFIVLKRCKDDLTQLHTFNHL
jgi:hypothetical protein